MSRKPRIHYPGGTYHVITRGNNKQNIFFSDEDRCHFYLLLQKAINQYDCRIHGFCLMTNHLHLAIQIGHTPLSKIMQNICFQYASWINKRYQRIGHLFQGRYKAILVEREPYLQELIRYIHLNPMRANIITKNEEYRWSSHRAYLGLDTLPWLTTQWVLSLFASDLKAARIRYQQFIQARQSNNTERKIFLLGNQKNQCVLGTDRFMAQLQQSDSDSPKSGFSLEELTILISQYYHIAPDFLKTNKRTHGYNKIRATIAWFAQELNICNLTTAAAYFKRNVANLGRSLRQLTSNTSKDELDLLKKHLKL